MLMYKDQINRVKFTDCAFSHDGEHIIGASTGHNAMCVRERGERRRRAGGGYLAKRASVEEELAAAVTARPRDAKKSWCWLSAVSSFALARRPLLFALTPPPLLSPRSIFIWTTDSTRLVDILKGPQVQIASLAHHPKRACVATGMKDGCIDIWGIPINWTALAPDFQALPRNVLYMEKEDEFDVVDEGEESDAEDEVVDVVGIEKVAVFESDSEDENEVFMLKLGSDAFKKDGKG